MKCQLRIITSDKNIIHYVWLGICCAGAGILAAIASYNNCLWTDELYTLITARRPFMEGLLQLQDYSAPMYQLILRLIVHNDFPSEWTVRAPALLFALLGLVSIWWLAKILFNQSVAALTVFIVAFNPVFLQFAAEGRPYTMFLLFSVLSVGTFYRFMLDRSHHNLFLYVCSTILLIYSHYYGLLILPAEVLLFFTYMILNRGSRNFKKMLYAFCAVGFLSIPALLLISRYILIGAPDIFSPPKKWLATPNLTDFFLVDKVAELFSSMTVGILCIWAFIAAALITFHSLRKNEFTRVNLQKLHFESWSSCYLSTLICFFWIGTSLYLLLIISYFFKPLYYFRYALPVMVPCAILFSAVTCNMRKNIQIILLILIVASFIPQIRTKIGDARQDYPKMVSQLKQANHDKSLVYVTFLYREQYISSEEYGLHYYGYNEPNIILLKFANHEVQEPRLLQTAEHYFVVDFMYKDKVDEYLKRSSRVYKKTKFGELTLFEVNKILPSKQKVSFHFVVSTALT